MRTFQVDSNYGKYGGTVEASEGAIVVDGKGLKYYRKGIRQNTLEGLRSRGGH
jgi:glyceraldehyde-3-phosphate dehydrogenase/erythrose-4-phosphate dehydrogenase